MYLLKSGKSRKLTKRCGQHILVSPLELTGRMGQAEAGAWDLCRKWRTSLSGREVFRRLEQGRRWRYRLYRGITVPELKKLPSPWDK